MNATIIAIILFTILCPCISYIVVKKKVFPWNGGIFLVNKNGTFFPKTTEKDGMHIFIVQPESIISGFFLPGADARQMPQINTYHHIENQQIQEQVGLSWQQEDGGVRVVFSNPMTKNFGTRNIEIITKNPVYGDLRRLENDSYMSWFVIFFGEPEKKSDRWYEKDYDEKNRWCEN